MLVYFLLVAFPLGAALTSSHRPRKHYPWFWVYFVVLVLICGLRFEVGPDWSGYNVIYEQTLELPWEQVVRSSEPGFLVLNKLCQSVGLGFPGVVLGGSLIFLYGAFKYARRTPNPWLAIAAITPYLVLVISMSGIRQSCAIGIGFLLLANWERYPTVWKVAIVALATAFHNSAVVLLFFVLLDMKGSIFLRLGLSLLPVAMLVYGLNTADTLERYRTVYVQDNLISDGALFHVLLVAIPATLYLLCERTLRDHGLADRNVKVASVLTLAMMPLLAFSSTGVDRLTLYFSFVEMWAYPALLYAGVMDRQAMRLGVSTLILAIFFVYFQFGSHAFAYLPYRNIIFP